MNEIVIKEGTTYDNFKKPFRILFLAGLQIYWVFEYFTELLYSKTERIIDVNSIAHESLIIENQ